ncbi:choline dehydrogenase-like protein [Amylocarpus encephaloides]|uniref:Choline dehydrogenase-like protein n=1 Tax=Amylocarpus encephaloides TaxID=45428 RepID=A0A9P8C6S3_9HELO|nr:choline dehydrogenase-like protein [Amylocarpus encephaloides]
MGSSEYRVALPNQPHARAEESTFAAVKHKTYDYVIVGGGLTGLVVGNRLSENKRKSVLVIENGYIDDRPVATIPYGVNLDSSDLRYPMMSAPEPFLHNTSYTVFAGNAVGGGSIVNGMLFDRGSNADYDSWEKLGNPGWGWNGMAKYFKKSSHFTPPLDPAAVQEFGLTYDASAYGNGPVQSHLTSFQYPDIKAIFASYRAEDIPMPREGFSDPIGAYWIPSDINTKNWTRCSAREAYYDPASIRSNFKLLTGTRVNKILFGSHGRKKLVAKGVQMVSRADNSVAKVYARNEVILAAGGIFTPQLLMLSGIGPKDILTAAKIPVKQDTPAVGANFQDHPQNAMSFTLTNTSFPDPGTFRANATFTAEAKAQFDKDRTGPYTFARGSAAAFLTFKQYSANYRRITAKIFQQDPLKYLPERYSREKSLLAGFMKQREILIGHFLGNQAAIGEGLIHAWGRSTLALQKPLSRGTLTLNTTNPEGFPVVLWNTIMNPFDADVFCEMVRWNRVHWARKELSQFHPIEAFPGAQYKTNEEIIEQSITSGILTPTFAHTSGGASMMPRKLGGVVDSDLLVYGVEKLSIVDASILPLIPSTHLQATMYAVAEKAADIIKGR